MGIFRGKKNRICSLLFFLPMLSKGILLLDFFYSSSTLMGLSFGWILESPGELRKQVILRRRSKRVRSEMLRVGPIHTRFEVFPVIPMGTVENH